MGSLSARAGGVGATAYSCTVWSLRCRRAGPRTSSSARCCTGSGSSTGCPRRRARPRRAARSCTRCSSDCSTCRPPSAPRRPPRRSSLRSGRGCSRRSRTLASVLDSDEQGFGRVVRPGGRADPQVVHPRGPDRAGAGRARALRRDRPRRADPARVRRPARRGPGRRGAGRRLQDRPVPERGVRTRVAVPDAVLCPRAVAAARGRPADAAAGLPRRRGGDPLPARRRRPAGHRTQHQGAVGGHRTRHRHRRLAPAHVTAVRMVRAP